MEKKVSDLLEALLDNEPEHKIGGAYFWYILRAIQNKMNYIDEKQTFMVLIQGIKELNLKKEEKGSPERALLYLGDNAFAIAYFQEVDGSFVRREGKQIICCNPHIIEEVQAVLT